MAIEKVAVLGGGLMGSGIAESVARAGIEVTVRDVDGTAVDAARDRIERVAAAGRERRQDRRGGARRDPRPDHPQRRPRVRRRGRPGGRGGARERRAEGQHPRPGRRLRLRAGADRLQHLLDPDRPARRRPAPARARPRPALLQPGAGDAAGRGGRRPRHLRGDAGRRQRVRRGDRQDADRDQGPLRLHRQHAAGPLPDGGGADVRRRVRDGRVDRRGDEARLRPPDGTAGALATSSASTSSTASATPSTRSSSAPSTRRRRC